MLFVLTVLRSYINNCTYLIKKLKYYLFRHVAGGPGQATTLFRLRPTRVIFRPTSTELWGRLRLLPDSTGCCRVSVRLSVSVTSLLPDRRSTETTAPRPRRCFPRRDRVLSAGKGQCLFRPHRMHAVHRCALFGLYSLCVFVCLSVGDNRELCRNGWTDRGAVWDVDSSGTKRPCIRWDRDSRHNDAAWHEQPLLQQQSFFSKGKHLMWHVRVSPAIFTISGYK